MVIMKSRLAAIAALGRELAIPASVLASIAAFGSAGFENSGAAPIVDRLVPLLAANATFSDKQPPIAFDSAEVVTAVSSATETEPADPAPVAQELVAQEPAVQEPEPIVTAALTDPSETLAPETPPVQVAKTDAATTNTATTNTPTREPVDANRGLDSTEVLDECFVADTCIDRYLWAVYRRAPKEDAVKTREQRKVTVKKRGKLVTVTKTFTTLTDEDFSWKDPKAAEKAGMSMVDYVIGGMDRDFKSKLFHMLHAAEEAGLAPGITSAFRDDYRQSIATGLKAADDRSYHGGSSHGGYGHGLAADLVSVNGTTRAQRLTSTETFWKWIDAHGNEFGIGRPYLDRDPPHVAPIDGKEYADHHPGMKARQVKSAANGKLDKTRPGHAHAVTAGANSTRRADGSSHERRSDRSHT
jgi:hypothetical protein